MKSEERHQLLTNDLGVVTTRTVGFFERHSGTLISVTSAVLLLAGIGFWWTRASDSVNAAGWTKLDSAQNLEEFGAVLDEFKGKPPGQWAQLQISEKTLQSAMPLMFTNREIALTDLKRSREGFESLVQDKTASAEIRERALWGLALTLETACDGDTSKPIEAFEKLISDFPESMFRTVAEERIAALKTGGAKEFYAWFSKETPKPPEARPRDFKPGSVHLPAPKGSDDEPDDFILKKSQTPSASPDGKKSETEPATGEKSEGKDKPAEKTEAEKPADPSKPVEGEKPAEDKAPKDGEKPPEKN